jgi:ribonuclease D
LSPLANNSELSTPPMSTPSPTHADHAVAGAWITDRDDLETWLQQVGNGEVLGMDTEFTRRNTFYPQLSLLQLAHRDRHALVDPLAFDLADTLQRHIGQRPIICVMHSAGEDLETLAPWLPDGPANLFDTQLAAAFAGLELGLGYRALVARFCHVELDKGETRSDWNRRPLSEAQKRYATLDVVYLDALHDALVTRLRQHHHESWFDADCERLKQRAHPDVPPAQPQRDLASAADWPAPRQALLRRILLWRERAARANNRPRTWLIDNSRALTLAREPPTDMNQLREITRGQRALHGPQRRELLDLLHRPPDAQEIAATAAIPSHPRGQIRDTVRRMKRVVDELARQLELPPGLLCPRKNLEAFASTGQWPASLEGWRRKALQSRLQAELPELPA